MRLMVLAALVPFAACSNFGGDDGGPGIAGTGSGGTRSFAVADFTAVELRGADDVDIRVGAGFSVRAEGDPAILDKLKIERVGGTLRIGRVRPNGWIRSKGRAKVYVTMPRLTEAGVAGSGDMAIDRVEGARFAGSIAGSGSLGLAALAVEEADFSIAGSGNLTAAGRAGALGVDIAGSGDVAASGLAASRATISIAGSGGVRAAVDGPATVSVMGSGDVDLGPRAQCRTSKMGSGIVRCGG